MLTHNITCNENTSLSVITFLGMHFNAIRQGGFVR